MEGAVLRLRPIMMTMLVATLGLLPAAISHGIGSDSQRPFAIVIVGGLISDLVMSIFLLPTLYAWFARTRRSASGAGNGMNPYETEGGPDNEKRRSLRSHQRNRHHPRDSRVFRREDAHFAAEAVTRGGIPIVEITMTVPGAVELISHLAQLPPEDGRRAPEPSSTPTRRASAWMLAQAS